MCCCVLLYSTSQNYPKGKGYQLPIGSEGEGGKVAAYLKKISQNLPGFLVVCFATLVSICRAVNP